MRSALVNQSHFSKWLFCSLLVAVGLLAACAEDPGPVELSGHTMGTTWHVTYTHSELSSPASRAQLRTGIEKLLQGVNTSMSTYQSDSEISRFNRQDPNQWFSISPGFLLVLETAMTIGEKSHGAYDVTVGPVVDLWGFGPNPRADSVPDEALLHELLGQVGQDELQLDGENRALLKLSELSLDFSSIAKGYGVDQVAEWLALQGLQDFLVEIGGEMRLSGKNPRGEKWRIAIEQPNALPGSVARAISVSNNAVATSGDYRNYFEVDGRRYSHTIDPRTGYPISHDLVSVTVIHPQSMIADAWATALMVMGSQDAMAMAQEQGLAVYFIRRTGQEYVTSYSPLFSSYLDVQH